MALSREQIEHLEHEWIKLSDKPWRKTSRSRRYLKKQMNKFIRLQGKKISDDETGTKQGRKPLKGWEY